MDGGVRAGLLPPLADRDLGGDEVARALAERGVVVEEGGGEPKSAVDVMATAVPAAAPAVVGIPGELPADCFFARLQSFRDAGLLRGGRVLAPSKSFSGADDGGEAAAAKPALRLGSRVVRKLAAFDADGDGVPASTGYESFNSCETQYGVASGGLLPPVSLGTMDLSLGGSVVSVSDESPTVRSSNVPRT